MTKLNGFGSITTSVVSEVRDKFGTPCYLYDETLLVEKCRRAMSMPNAYGLRVRYAMKANSNRTLLKIIAGQGLYIDASSLNEARRAEMAGIEPGRIMLTTQEVPEGADRRVLEDMMLRGMRYNVCSLRQLRLVADFASANGLALSVRVHPGVGSGESATRNTGDDYSCFGIHLTDIAEALQIASEKKLLFSTVHVHIGSGGDPEMWRRNIDLELGFVEKYFPDADTVNFGGGLKEARMPHEKAADINALGLYAKERIEDFYRRTGRKLFMEIEPGTFIAANMGYVVTTVRDKKKTGESGLCFAVVDGGMDLNARPLLYGALHPFYVISRDGRLLSSEFTDTGTAKRGMMVVGTCCETGDSLCLDGDSNSAPRPMAEPETGDLVVIGGAGAYCSAMTPFNYNSHLQAPEVLYTTDGRLKLIRRRQTLEQMLINEI
ncbi:MAG: diaminopimelate decarboxylase [Clostridiales bacterium]|jgi:diaminopimelate decarboxylase|nr:diaminopimelate decarboxylase [Clostridiales bacterium]